MKLKNVLLQLIPPTPGPLPEADGTNRSIVSTEPQSDLYPVHSFERDFHSLLNESALNGRYKTYFAEPAEERRARERCDLSLDINEVNDVFGDPTVLGLLNEWQDSLHQRHIKEEQEGLRPTWSSVYGQIEDTTEYGDRSTAHYKEPLKIQPIGGSQLARMLNDSTRGRRRARPMGRADRSGAPNSSSQQIPQSTVEDSGVEGTVSTTPNPSTSGETSASISSNPETTPTIPAETSNQVTTGADILKILQGQQPDEELYQKNARLVQELAQNADKDVERIVQESRFLKTPMEINFQRLSLKLEACPLKTLAPGSRIDIPVGHRPQVNYVDPEGVSSAQKLPIGHPTLLSNEVVLNVVFYKAHRPSQPMQEFMVLGSQRLSALRDAFHCVMDFMTQGADDAQRSALVQNTRTKKTSNSFMMIEGVFYNDSPLLRAKIEEKHRLLEEQEQEKEQLVAGQTDGEGRHGSSMDTDAGTLTSGSNRNVAAETPIEDIFVRNHAEYARHSLDYSQ